MTSSGRSERLCLAVILLLGLGLRVHGLDWGLPNEVHAFSYHPDEWQMVESAVGLAQRHDANPRFFNYPSLTIYLAWLVTIPLRLAGLGLPAHYLAARLLGVGFGLAAIGLTWRLGRGLAGPRVGLVAAGLLAVAPLHVVNSRFATVDGPLTCFTTLALWGACELTRANGPSRRRWLLAGAVAVGLAAGTKYNGALALLPLWTAIGLLRGKDGWRDGLLITAIAAGVFALTSPYVFLDFGHAWPAIRFELIEHPQQSNLFADVGPGWLFHLTQNLPTAAGGPWAIMALAGFVILVKERRGWPLLVFALVLCASLLRTRELFIRYWLPLLPLLAVSSAVVVGRLRDKPVLGWALLLLIAAGPLLRSRAYAAMLAQPDARDEAAAWCFQQLPKGATVGLDGQPWFWSVPLNPNNGGARTTALGSESRYVLRPDPGSWRDAPPEWLVINRTHWDEGTSDEDTARMLSGYTLVEGFENRATVWPGWVETGQGSRRHDWNYVLARVEVYRRAIRFSGIGRHRHHDGGR